MATLNFAGFVFNPETGAGVGGITVTAHLVLGDKTLTAGAAATTTTSSGVDIGYWSFSVVTTTDGAQYAIKYTNPANGQVRYQRPEAQMQVGLMQGTLVGGVLVAPVPDGSVVTAKIADSAITSAKIAAGAVIAGKYGAASIVNADISASAAIAGSKLAAGSVTATQVAADVATQAELDAHAATATNPHGATLTQTNLTVNTAATLPAGATVGGLVPMTTGNDGSGSGYDADMVDGSHASAFATSGHSHNSPVVKAAQGNYTGNGVAGRIDAITFGGAVSAILMVTITENSGSCWHLGRNANGFGVIPGAGPASDEVFRADAYFGYNVVSGYVQIGVTDVGFGANVNSNIYHWVALYAT